MELQVLRLWKNFWKINMIVGKWINDRIKERTSWDGAALVVMGLLAVFAANLAKLVGGVAVLYGLWTIFKKEQ